MSRLHTKIVNLQGFKMLLYENLKPEPHLHFYFRAGIRFYFIRSAADGLAVIVKGLGVTNPQIQHTVLITVFPS